MCGIIGYFVGYNSSVSTNSRISTLSALLDANTLRGRDGFGITVRSATFDNESNHETETPFVRKVPGSTYNPAQPPSDLFGLSMTAGMINCRAEPTTEITPSPTHADQQPYTCGKWTIIHNGTIANDRELYATFLGVDKASEPTQIDSWVIVRILDHLERVYMPGYAVSEIFRFALGLFKGSFALIAQHSDHPTMMLYACDFRPLYEYYDGKVIRAISSVPFRNSKLVAPYSTGIFTLDSGAVQLDGLRDTSEYDIPRSLVVLSGGLDSTTVAAMLKHAGHYVELLHFTYGCRAQERELIAVSAIATALNCRLHILDMTEIFKGIGHSRLLEKNPEYHGEAGAEQAIEWVPARNTILSSIAMGIAEANNFHNIALGINLEEAGGGYTDNVLDLYEGFNGLMHWIIGYGKQLKFISPVGHLMKHEIVREGLAVNAPLHLTWSCYNADEVHCGECGPCIMRKRAFELAGQKDPVF